LALAAAANCVESRLTAALSFDTKTSTLTFSRSRGGPRLKETGGWI
jgi:hypothetical protein